MRPPYTADFICTVHHRPGDDPNETACGAYLFRPKGEGEPARAGEDAATVPTKPIDGKRYKRRPEPAEVTAAAFGALFMVSTGQGPEYPMPRDQFNALYEAIESEEKPESEGALANAPAGAVDVEKAADQEVPE